MPYPERRICTIELTQAEAIGLLERARCGEEAQQAFNLSLPEGTTKHESDRAERKLTQALAAESGHGGNFENSPAHRGEDPLPYQMPSQPTPWRGRAA